MPDTTWAIMPVLAGPEMTEHALSDLLAQSVPTRILVVNQGVDTPFRERLERIAEEHDDRVLVWSHVPPLPSLSASWNRALRFVWESGGTEALVCNNDVRLHIITCALLSDVRRIEDALFVTAVGVAAEQFHPADNLVDVLRTAGLPYDSTTIGSDPRSQFGILRERAISKGGPDFSCYLISREGHEKYPFDENFIPCYGEDCDMHRRYMLGGDGDKIFSINLPFHHIGAGSQTLKSMDADKRAAWEHRINTGSRAYYQRKWGGPVNGERYTIPFDPASAQDGVTTPDLQRAIQGVPADQPQTL